MAVLVQRPVPFLRSPLTKAVTMNHQRHPTSTLQENMQIRQCIRAVLTMKVHFFLTTSFELFTVFSENLNPVLFIVLFITFFLFHKVEEF